MFAKATSSAGVAGVPVPHSGELQQEESTLSNKPYQLARQKVDQLEEKIRSHRLKILKQVIFLIMLALIVAGVLYFVYETRSYSDYQVLESTERQDSAGTSFLEFGGNILKYGNDGIFYIDAKNRMIWNQTYEMQSPMVDICGDYVVVADQKGKKIYIMNKSGPCGELETNRPIRQVHVANQGMVAALMEEEGTGYIQLYDRTGRFLAEGVLHARNSGYPLDIAISDDGKKMVTAVLDINEGEVRTTVSFYNFGSVGQNEIDNIVSSYPYSDTMISRVEFLTNDAAVAVGDDRLIFYEGKQKPVVKKEIAIDREIRSVFYNDNYVGLVFEQENEETPFCMEVYDIRGSKVRNIDFSMEYEKIEFLGNDEICIRNNLECSIYTLRGTKRFHYNFEKDLCKVIHTRGRQYLFLMSGTTERVKLK